MTTTASTPARDRWLAILVAYQVLVGSLTFAWATNTVIGWSALTKQIAAGLHVSTGAAGLFLTAAGLGQGLGVALLVALSAFVDRRRYLFTRGLAAAALLMTLPFVPGYWPRIGVAFMVGALVPFEGFVRSLLHDRLRPGLDGAESWLFAGGLTIGRLPVLWAAREFHNPWWGMATEGAILGGLVTLGRFARGLPKDSTEGRSGRWSESVKTAWAIELRNPITWGPALIGGAALALPQTPWDATNSFILHGFWLNWYGLFGFLVGFLATFWGRFAARHRLAAVLAMFALVDIAFASGLTATSVHGAALQWRFIELAFAGYAGSVLGLVGTIDAGNPQRLTVYLTSRVVALALGDQLFATVYGALGWRGTVQVAFALAVVGTVGALACRRQLAGRTWIPTYPCLPARLTSADGRHPGDLIRVGLDGGGLPSVCIGEDAHVRAARGPDWLACQRVTASQRGRWAFAGEFIRPSRLQLIRHELTSRGRPSVGTHLRAGWIPVAPGVVFAWKASKALTTQASEDWLRLIAVSSVGEIVESLGVTLEVEQSAAPSELSRRASALVSWLHSHLDRDRLTVTIGVAVAAIAAIAGIRYVSAAGGMSLALVCSARPAMRLIVRRQSTGRRLPMVSVATIVAATAGLSTLWPVIQSLTEVMRPLRSATTREDMLVGVALAAVSVACVLLELWRLWAAWLLGAEVAARCWEALLVELPGFGLQGQASVTVEPRPGAGWGAVLTFDRVLRPEAATWVAQRIGRVPALSEQRNVRAVVPGVVTA